jgi:hypothetical protein
VDQDQRAALALGAYEGRVIHSAVSPISSMSE